MNLALLSSVVAVVFTLETEETRRLRAPSHAGLAGFGRRLLPQTAAEARAGRPSARPAALAVQLDTGAAPADPADIVHTKHAAHQAQRLLPHRRGQQEVHDGVQAAVEGRKQQSHLVGFVGNAAPETRRVCDLGPYVEHPDQVVGHETDGEEDEDDEGLPGGSGVAGGVGQVRFLLRRSQKRERDRSIINGVVYYAISQ